MAGPKNTTFSEQRSIPSVYDRFLPRATEISINLIPHTVHHTALGTLTAGSRVNLEIDLLARYVERMLSATAPKVAA